MSLARVSVRLESIAAAKRQKKAAVPAIGQTEIHFNGSFRLFGGVEGRANAIQRRSRSVTFAGGRRSLE
jgi:hypothetical protein